MNYELEDVIDNLKYSDIRPSEIHGNGLFATDSIPEDTELGQLDGQLIPETLHHKMQLTLEWNAIEENVLLVRPYRTKYSYINHSRTPNLKLVGIPLRVITTRAVKSGEEFTLDYREEKLSKEYIDTKGKYYL
ncbi:SET domain-containing protein-lysine N-methyltransferase [Alteromonas halophila]|uniref:SET domain-containing protein n=1 Tax=Alteromonas halophila TaxID=516698 RepID=A0A918JMA7_9ALTE|nr:SET domain-containing protein [Alteromonas halophila]GGW89240.1 hypothetical protein GCM10007391_24320 [Alteromonas halophila]